MAPCEINIEEPEVVRLDRLYDKKARYNSHIKFLSKCINEKVVPKGLCIQLEPTIGNFDQNFVNNWYQKLNKFSIELMNDIVNFCKETNTSIDTQIKAKESQIKEKSTDGSYAEIKKAIDTNQENRIKSLEQNKNKKFNRIKYHANQQTERIGRPEEESSRRRYRRSRSRSRSQQNNYQTYASVLKNNVRPNTKQSTSKTNHYSNTQPRNNRDEQIEALQQQITYYEKKEPTTTPTVSPIQKTE